MHNTNVHLDDCDYINKMIERISFDPNYIKQLTLTLADRQKKILLKNFFINSNIIEKYIDSVDRVPIEVLINNVHESFMRSCIYNPSVNRQLLVSECTNYIDKLI